MNADESQYYLKLKKGPWSNKVAFEITFSLTKTSGSILTLNMNINIISNANNYRKHD